VDCILYKLKKKNTILAIGIFALLVWLVFLIFSSDDSSKKNSQVSSSSVPEVVVVQENTTVVSENVVAKVSNVIPNNDSLIKNVVVTKTRVVLTSQDNSSKENTPAKNLSNANISKDSVQGEIVDNTVQPVDQFFVDWNNDGKNDLVRRELDGKYYVFPNKGTDDAPIYDESYLYNETN
jgi:hypothetical protein